MTSRAQKLNRMTLTQKWIFKYLSTKADNKVSCSEIK